jgi:hypothetical protein
MPAPIAKVLLGLTAAKSPQRLTRHLATPPAVFSFGGLRTPARVPGRGTLHGLTRVRNALKGLNRSRGRSRRQAARPSR